MTKYKNACFRIQKQSEIHLIKELTNQLLLFAYLTIWILYIFIFEISFGPIRVVAILIDRGKHLFTIYIKLCTKFVHTIQCIHQNRLRYWWNTGGTSPIINIVQNLMKQTNEKESTKFYIPVNTILMKFSTSKHLPGSTITDCSETSFSTNFRSQSIPGKLFISIDTIIYIEACGLIGFRPGICRIRLKASSAFVYK